MSYKKYIRYCLNNFSVKFEKHWLYISNIRNDLYEARSQVRRFFKIWARNKRKWLTGRRLNKNAANCKRSVKKSIHRQKIEKLFSREKIFCCCFMMVFVSKGWKYLITYFESILFMLSSDICIGAILHLRDLAYKTPSKRVIFNLQFSLQASQ